MGTPSFEEWQRILAEKVMSAFEVTPEELGIKPRTGLPVYFGHPRSSAKTSAMYVAMGSEPFGTVEDVFGAGTPYGAPHSRTTVMSLGTGQVLVLTGPDAGTLK